VRWSLSSSSGKRGSAAAAAADLASELHVRQSSGAGDLRQMQRNKSRLGSGQSETLSAAGQAPADSAVLRVGGRGRPVTLSEGGIASADSMCSNASTMQVRAVVQA
jgi:hypothetical protein